MKEEPAEVGRGARRRGTPLSILGFRVGAVVAGGGGAVAWGSPKKKLDTGGLEGWPGRRRTGGPAVGSVFGAGRAAHRRPRAAGGCCLAGGGWRLRGVEFEDEPRALDFISNDCKID